MTRHSAALLAHGVLALVVLCALPAVAAEDSPGVWGEVGIQMLRSDRWMWMFTPEVRTDESLPHPLFIGRASTSLRYKLSKGWSLRAGYWFVARGQGHTSLGLLQTVSGGVSYPLPWTGAVGVGSSIYEHQWVPTQGERDRLRQRFEFLWDTGAVSPWSYEELTFSNGSGFVRSRTRLGLAFTIPKGWELRTGYQFQALKQSSGAWAPRHEILLQLRTPVLFDLRSKHKKEKKKEPEQQLEDLDK